MSLAPWTFYRFTIIFDVLETLDQRAFNALFRVPNNVLSAKVPPLYEKYPKTLQNLQNPGFWVHIRWRLSYEGGISQNMHLGCKNLYWYLVYLLDFRCATCTKMLPISWILNHFSKFRMLREAEITYYSFPRRKHCSGGLKYDIPVIYQTYHFLQPKCRF